MSERRAEAQAMLQILVVAAPGYVAAHEPLNLESIIADYLAACDVASRSRWQKLRARLPKKRR